MLANDVCRCTSEKCEERDTCLRWLERFTEANGVVRYNFADMWNNTKPCKYKINALLDEKQ